MLLSLTSKFLSTLLVFVLWSGTITLVMSQTVFSSKYVETQLDTAKAYDRLSAGLVDEIAHMPDLAANPEVAAKIQPILTPEVLKAKINPALEQTEAYYRGKGPAPSIDLSDLAAQAQAAGVPVGEGSGLTKPIVIGSADASQAQQVGKTYDNVRTTTLISAVVLVVALLAVSWQRKRYTALPTVLIIVGVLIGLLALVLHFAPGTMDKYVYVKFGSAPNAFALLVKDLTGSIANDWAKRYGFIAAGYLAVGIVTRIVASRLQKSSTAVGSKPTPVVRNQFKR